MTVAELIEKLDGVPRNAEVGFRRLIEEPFEGQYMRDYAVRNVEFEVGDYKSGPPRLVLS